MELAVQESPLAKQGTHMLLDRTNPLKQDEITMADVQAAA
jgi:hypothetical protein